MLDIFRRVLRLPDHRVPLTLCLPSEHRQRLVAKQRSAFGAELHMVLMILQACNSLATAEFFIAESETHPKPRLKETLKEP